MGDEREKHPRTEDPDVEGHQHAHKLQDDAPADKGDDGDDDTPDVEGHAHFHK